MITKENAHLYLPIVQAMMDGKRVSCAGVLMDSVNFSAPPESYEIVEPDGDIYGECASEIHRLEREVEELREDLKLIERWAVYKIGKHTAEECLSVIQHYPPIKAITKSYKDGVIPTSYNPYAEIEQLRAKVAELEVYRTAGVILINRLCNIPKYNVFWIERARAMYAICQYDKSIGVGKIPQPKECECANENYDNLNK